MAYETQPGTIPHRAVAHLKTLDAGAEVSAPELAEVLGVDSASIVPSLIFPCKHGALTRRKKEARHSARKVWWYALGDGQPEQPGQEDDEPLRRATSPRQPASPASSWVPPIKVKDAPTPAPAPVSVREYIEKIGPEPTGAARPFDAWLSAHDALVLQGITLDEDGDALLQPKHVAALRKLLGAPA